LTYPKFSAHYDVDGLYFFCWFGVSTALKGK